MDTSREDRCRSIRRICRTGETPISTPHAAAAKASPVTTMTLPSSSAPGLGGPCSPADLVRGASTAVAHGTSRGRRSGAVPAPVQQHNGSRGARWHCTGMSAEVAMSLALLDWRRRVARLYAEVRAEPDVAAAHEHWRKTRDDLLRTHPESPVPQRQRAGYPGAPVAPYD